MFERLRVWLWSVVCRHEWRTHLLHLPKKFIWEVVYDQGGLCFSKPEDPEFPILVTHCHKCGKLKWCGELYEPHHAIKAALREAKQA